jgi:23S rRNA pseudouridine1911/1915/1917 synthase
VIPVLYADADLAVVDKPAGMLSHPTRPVREGTLVDRLAEQLGHKPILVHRLDKGTSGVLVVALHPRAATVLARHFRERRVEKRYRALVHGIVAEDERRIQAPIGRVDGWPGWRVVADGKPATSGLRVLDRRGDRTLVELEPVTGRTNQLRIHCAHVGHPIVGDEAYGSPEVGRLWLHAARLAFYHPAGRGWMVFDAPLPPELA